MNLGGATMPRTRLSSDELMHYGVLGMKWGHRKASRTLNKKLRKSFKALDAYNKSSSTKTIKSPVDGSIRTITIDNVKKRNTYDKAVKAVNAYMDKLDKKGYDWRYDSNYGVTGRLTENGRGYVETIVGDVKTRKEFD